MLTRPVRGSLHLGDDCRVPGHLGLADHAPPELGADDAQVPKLLAARELAGPVEEGEPRAWVAMKQLGFVAGVAAAAEVARKGLGVDDTDAPGLADEAIAELKAVLG